MKNIKSITLGILIGTITTLSITALAEYIVVPNSFPVKVNGQTVQVEGYNINDSTYFKLRDVAAAVGGFEVGFEDNAIVVNTPNKPTPEPTVEPTVSADITIIKGEDGNDYTSDGLQIHYVDDIAYVMKGSIQRQIESIGIAGYSFSTSDLVKSESDGYKSVLSNIPLCPTNSQLIPVDFYISTILPLINTLK